MLACTALVLLLAATDDLPPDERDRMMRRLQQKLSASEESMKNADPDTLSKMRKGRGGVFYSVDPASLNKDKLRVGDRVQTDFDEYKPCIGIITKQLNKLATKFELRAHCSAHDTKAHGREAQSLTVQRKNLKLLRHAYDVSEVFFVGEQGTQIKTQMDCRTNGWVEAVPKVWAVEGVWEALGDRHPAVTKKILKDTRERMKDLRDHRQLTGMSVLETAIKEMDEDSDGLDPAAALLAEQDEFRSRVLDKGPPKSREQLYKEFDPKKRQIFEPREDDQYWFKIIDTDHDGKVTREELIAHVRDEGLAHAKENGITKQVLLAVFKNKWQRFAFEMMLDDLDKDGTLSRTEFRSAHIEDAAVFNMAPNEIENAKENAEEFAEMDIDLDGYLTREEFRTHIKDHTLRTGASPDVADRATESFLEEEGWGMWDFDHNGDDMIEFHEVYDWYDKAAAYKEGDSPHTTTAAEREEEARHNARVMKGEL